MNNRIYLNDQWKYTNHFEQSMINDEQDYDWEAIRLPHANVQTPYNYFNEKIYQFVSCYRRDLEVKEEWKGKPILLTFEGVAHIAKVYVNGALVTTHYGGYTAFTDDISSYLKYECRENGVDTAISNTLVVEVDSREDNNIPPFGKVIDYLTYGGIYREVYLEVKEPIYIGDAFITTRDVELEEKTLEFIVTLVGKRQEGTHLRYTITSKDKDTSIILTEQKLLTDRITKITQSVKNVENWDLDHPVLYTLHLELWKGEIQLDIKQIRFGFRTCEFRVDGCYLNNKKIKLLGLNRHQSYPYVGYAMPKRMQWQDADILKNELNVNAVRTSHYPQSQHFIDRCDELGILVFTEIPGWQHIGDQNWKCIACENVREMVMQYRNHPSIILWGVRINESQDDDDFYRKTNQIAHELDQSRQTGGVRYLKKSSLLEDVYTYNDFLHNGITKGLDDKNEVTSNPKAPYLVSEFNGHMFPTKSFDSEDHRLKHALRHATVLDALFEQEQIAGGFGWCMFDYNTHQEFGSGDKICYHGVMDMFRNPKLAAAVYASQNDKGSTFEISSTMDIGEHPGGAIGEVYAFTNADYVRLYKNDRMIKEFHPMKKKYHHLPHPPIIIDDFVGDLMEIDENMKKSKAEKIKEVLFAINRYGQNNLPLKYKIKMAYLMLKENLSISEGIRLYYEYIGNWGSSVTTYKFEAVRENQVVKTVERRPVRKPRLKIIPVTLELKEEETYDVSRIRILAVDEYDNQLLYYQEPITLEVSGCIELIGPNIISLKGGATGTFVKTIGKKGEGILRIYQENLGETIVNFYVE